MLCISMWKYFLDVRLNLFSLYQNCILFVKWEICCSKGEKWGKFEWRTYAHVTQMGLLIDIASCILSYYNLQIQRNRCMYLVLLCIWMKVFQEQARLLSDVQKKKEGKLKLPESSQPMMFFVFFHIILSQ